MAPWCSVASEIIGLELDSPMQYWKVKVERENNTATVLLRKNILQ